MKCDRRNLIDISHFGKVLHTQSSKQNIVMNVGHIYAIALRKFLDANLSVIKVGRTKDLIKRLQTYPNKSCILFTKQVRDDVITEKYVLATLKSKFIQRLDFGHEYFEGPSDQIVHCVQKCIIDLEEDNANRQYKPDEIFGLRLLESPSSTSIQYDNNSSNIVEVDSKKAEKACPLYLSNGFLSHKHKIVYLFYSENKEALEDKIVPSSRLYKMFLDWKNSKREYDGTFIHQQSLISGLRSMFIVKLRKSSYDGIVQVIIHFGNPINFMNESCQAFFDKHLIHTPNGDSFTTLDQINKAFCLSEFYSGQILTKQCIEGCLDTIIMFQKTYEQKVYTNVLVDYKFKPEFEHCTTVSSIDDWFNRNFKITNNDSDQIQSSILYQLYKAYTETAAIENPMSANFFGKQMFRLIGKKSVNVRNAKCYCGIRQIMN